MPEKIINYKCPACTGPLHYVGESGMLECDYCGSKYTVAEIESLYKEKVESAAEAAAAETAEEKAEAESTYAQTHSKSLYRFPLPPERRFAQRLPRIRRGADDKRLAYASVLAQERFQLMHDGDVPFCVLRFQGVYGVRLEVEVPANVDDAFFEIHVPPLKPENLAPTHARIVKDAE